MTIQLTLKARTPIKKKYKSHSPIVFAVPKELKDKIRKIFELSIKAMESGSSSSTDWYNAAFRTKHALEIAKVSYEKETELEFIPHPATWLNQERWEDELVIEPKKQKESKEWMFSNEGIEAKARELGLLGTGYDSYDSLKRKCMNKLGMSAL